MPVNFIVSAPGKVILNGEHSVVYGKAALAGVIGQRNHINIISHANPNIVINLDIFSDKKLVIPMEEFNLFLTHAKSVLAGESLPENIDHDRFLRDVRAFVNTCNVGANNLESYRKAISAIIYLLTVITVENSNGGNVLLAKGFTLNFESKITMGAGLGSSASYGVCLAGAFHFLTKLLQDPGYLKFYNHSATPEERDEILAKISSWAFCSERIMHGTPSGLDNAICTFGNLFKFYKGAKPITVKLNTALNILVVDTGVSRSTANVVKQVADLRGEYPQLIGSIMDAMGSLVDDVVLILENRESRSDIETYEKLRTLYTINNNLLRAIGVSHPVLEKIFTISERNGFSCKLTGAGAGGYAIVLLPPLFGRAPEYAALCKELDAEAFQYRDTIIGGSGFQVQDA